MISIILVVCVALYLVLVRKRRFQRLRMIHTTYDRHMHDMTPQIAQKIIQESLFYEVPLTMLLGTQIALVKVYGISSIAALLMKTRQIASPKSISKRLVDTSTLISTWVARPLMGPGSGEPPNLMHGPCDPRGAIAIARVNYLHGKYDIKNDDSLYNLALFVVETMNATARYDWRAHSRLERQAAFIFWAEVGRRMGIQDIWKTYEDMEEWVASYEAQYLVPSEASRKLFEITFNVVLRYIPNIPGFRYLTRGIILCLLDAPTRRAMILPDPPRLLSMTVEGIFLVRAFVIRHMCLPRTKPARRWALSDAIPSCPMGSAGSKQQLPRMATTLQRVPPWYYPEPTGWEKIKQDIKVSLGILSADIIPGKQWKSEGYRLEELGPEMFENKGHAEVMQAAAKIQGRPVTGPWALPPT